MKRATFTLFHHPKWLPMRRLALMFLLTWGFLGLKCSQAQILTAYSSIGDTLTMHTLTTCTGSPTTGSELFTDDNMIDGNYPDNRMRKDTIEICPEDDDHYVRLVMSNFDLDIGDTLFAYDGNLTAYKNMLAPVIGTGTGVGVSKGFGGWLDANCSPKVNPSGCITFLFQTDGDNAKGKGWEAWVDCAPRNIVLENVGIESIILAECSAAYVSSFTIPAPEVKACGVTLPTNADSVHLEVKNQLGVIIIDTILTYSGVLNAVKDTFAIGIYSVEYTLVCDPSVQLKVPFTVQAPTLVCNDNVQISLGSACILQIAPDDVLESFCDTISDTMYYNITIMLGTGKNQIIKTTSNYDNHEKVTYPRITTEDIKKAGMSICNATATVMIERIYYQLGGVETIPNNGIHRASCQTTVSFTDKSVPFISVSSDIDTLVACDTTGLFHLLNPIAIDNCDDEIPVTISFELEETDPCFTSKGSRDTTKAIITLSAVDDCGNIGSTIREVVIIRPDENKHIAKIANLTLDCTDSTTIGEMPGLQIGIIKNSKFIPRDTIPLNTNEYTCGYILTKKDIEIPTTECGRKLYRYWSIVDWCEPTIGPARVDTQLVNYTDLTPPSFKPGTGITSIVELGPYECSYDITAFPEPSATDNCSIPFVRLDSVFRVEDGASWPISKELYTQLDADSFELRWIAEDNCHEQLINDTLVQLVIIKDVTRPVAVCTDQLNVSIGSSSVIVNAEDVDAGSYDACGIFSREVSRDSVNYGPSVIFTCEDANDTIPIIFRVTDIFGNSSSCVVHAYIEDRIKPSFTSFESGLSFANGNKTGNTNQVSINCNEAKVVAILDLDNPTREELASIGGTLPLPKDNCQAVRNIELTPIVLSIGSCGERIYQRRWIAVDESDLTSLDTATQTITIEYVEDWKIIFPGDVQLSCPMSPSSVDSVIVENGSCDRLAINVESKMFNVVADACFKIVNTYHIINWCNYEVGDDPSHNFNVETLPEQKILTKDDLPDFGYITFTQIVYVQDNEGPVITLQDSIDECITGAHDGLAETVGDSLSCGEFKLFTAEADDCVVNQGGQLSHTYKLYQGTEQQVLAQQAPVVYELLVSETGNIAEMLAFVFPGTYTAEFVFTDNCGNSTLARKEYTFKECKKPTPYLLNGIAIELGQQTASIEVWANDFNQGSYDNCSIADSLIFKIWHISLGINPPTTAEGVLDSLPSSITFFCNYLGTQVVRIYVVDEAGNFDYAATYVLIQDNMRLCQADPIDNMVAGDITNFQGENIENVSVKIEGIDDMTMTTQADGHFQFILPKNESYTIIPEKNDDVLNGVSTYDLVLISKHILGIAPFDAFYKYIAADINKSGTITAFDMVQLRQIILNIQTAFPNNQSWRFVDKNEQFNANPLDEPFDEAITIENLDGNLMENDFVGVKIGDVNGNATTNNLLDATTRNANTTFYFQIKNQYVKAGETITIPIKAADIANIEGYQFTLNFTGLDFLKIKEGLVKAENFNTQGSTKGQLMSSWNGKANGNDLLYSLVFRANTSGYLNEFLTINSAQIKAEAYHQSGELMDVDFDFQKKDQPLVFQLEQNSPNPFSNETLIGFTLATEGLATLKVMDIQGKVLKTIQNYYSKGHHRINLDASSLGATGVLYYQLEAGSHLANKKMIILE